MVAEEDTTPSVEDKEPRAGDQMIEGAEAVYSPQNVKTELDRRPPKTSL